MLLGIITRSQAKKSECPTLPNSPAWVDGIACVADPEQYTRVPVPVKIIKLLIKDLETDVEAMYAKVTLKAHVSILSPACRVGGFFSLRRSIHVDTTIILCRLMTMAIRSGKMNRMMESHRLHLLKSSSISQVGVSVATMQPY